MYKLLSAILLILCSFVEVKAQSTIKRPKLVIGVVVDQMRQEYLLRFYDKFGEGGFKRMMNQGFMLRNAHFNYVPTYTGPGHASVYTGTTPRVHGVIGNSWYSRAHGRKINCVEDTSVQVVGGSEAFGAFSPVNLTVNTITDELKIFTQSRSKVIGISLKNRGAILPAGRNPNGAYWFDEVTYNFVTSTYYTSSLPQWMNDFNKRKLVEGYLKGKWETTFPVAEYTESGPDSNPYEMVWEGRKEPTFPYDLKKLAKDNRPVSVFKNSPFGAAVLTELAKTAIKSEEMGQDDVTDFLTVSYSSTDRVGHKFGPNSVEIEDTFVKLDRNLEDLMKYLDAEVGEGEYLIFLTSDHGVADVPRFLNNNKIPTWYVVTKKLQEDAFKFMASEYGAGEWILFAENEQIYLNQKEIKEHGLDLFSVREKLAGFLRLQKGIRKAIPAHKLNSDVPTRSDINALALGYNEDRSGDILLTLEPGWIPDEWYYFNYGTRHGSHYNYDTHAPVLFYGWGIKAGSTVKYHRITDIAPTLSMLLNIRLPNAATGHPIEEIFED